MGRHGKRVSAQRVSLPFALFGLLLGAAVQKKSSPPPSPYTALPKAESFNAIVEPKFVSLEAAESMLEPDEPVIGLALGSEARAYSLWQLERHLVVNDKIAGRAVAVTWCPFSHTAVVYSRNLGDKEVTLEPEGRLLHGTLLLRDRESKTVWAQADGAPVKQRESAAADYERSGAARLTPVPALQTRWKVWKQEQPGTLVLDKAGAPKGSPFAEYHADPIKLGPGISELREPRMGGKSFVVGLVSGDDRLAIPLDRLKRDWAVSAVVDRQAVVALYDPATETVRVVRTEARGRAVRLRRGYGDIFGKPTAPHLVDEETVSRWDFTGRALSGRFQGHRLPLFPYRVQFWYAWQAYFPKSRVE